MSLTQDILAGSVRATARLIRRLEDDPFAARQDMRELYPHTGRAYLIGLTGSPGVGKSTMTDRLITRLRAKGHRVGVVAVDPTSPFSGGAILGDRVRMQKHATDPDVFIRSLATRGAFGGLAAAARGVVHVLDAAGYDRILIETVGVGQDEVDIVRLAHSTMVVCVPGLGDEIQAIKAGIMEIADILVVNKADRPGTGKTVSELEAMLSLNKASGLEKPWWPPIRPVSAVNETGLTDLMADLETHRKFMTEERPDLLQDKIRLQSRELVMDLVKERVLARTVRLLNERGDWEDKLEKTVSRQMDPYSLAEEIYRSGID